MPNKNLGFTLIEVTLVMAISSGLFVIAFAGQRQLRDRANFDAAINKVIQEINYARTYASSNVNEVGGGNIPNTVIAGASIEFENQNIANFQLTEIEPIYASPNVDGSIDMSTLGNWPPGIPNPSPLCPSANHPENNWECYETFASLPDDLTVASANDASIFFINTANGLKICHITNSGMNMLPTICALPPTGPFPIDFHDSSGFTARIMIDDGSGMARRIN